MSLKSVFAIFASILIFASCSQKEDKQSLKVAATAVPHAEMLEQIKPDLKAQGIDLKIVVVEDFNTPNRALADKEVDANFFQHQPFLELQKREFKYPFEVLTAVHLEPMALYSKKIKALNELRDGALVAIPIDPTNQARALFLLESEGLIKLDSHDQNATLLNIVENPRHLSLQEIDPPLLARSLDDVDLAAINANFALQAGLNPKIDAIAREDKRSSYVNVIVIRKGEEQRADLQALKKAMTSEKVKAYINQKYNGSIIPAF